MNTDIDKYLKYVKNNSKRTGEMVDKDDIMKDLTESAMQILLHLADQLPMFKGRELTKFILSMKEDLKQSMEEIRNNIQLKEVDKVVKLSAIAIQSRCRDILNDVYDYSMTHRNESFKTCLNKVYASKEISKFQIKFHITNPHKKAKLAKEEKEVYEDLSDYQSSDEEEPDYGDNDDDDDDDDEDDEDEDPEQVAKDKLLSNKDNQEFIQHIFKTREEDPETKLLNYYANLP